MRNQNIREALELAIRQNEHDMILTGDELRLCRASLATDQKTVPEGFVLVPVEPTPEMLDAARRGVDYGDGVGLEHKNKLTRRQWKAMLAAAPKPEQQEAPAERECRHCGFLCRPNPAESRKWYPLEQAEPSGNPGEFAAPAGEQVGLTDAEVKEHFHHGSRTCKVSGPMNARDLAGIRQVIAAHDKANGRGGV